MNTTIDGMRQSLDAALARIAVLEAVVRELREELAQAQNAAGRLL